MIESFAAAALDDKTIWIVVVTLSTFAPSAMLMARHQQQHQPRLLLLLVYGLHKKRGGRRGTKGAVE